MKKIILEELSKQEIISIVRDELLKELNKQLKSMVEEEIKKVLGTKDIKNDIGDISKEILKKLYKDLSLHHTYVIDRVKL